VVGTPQGSEDVGSARSHIQSGRRRLTHDHIRDGRKGEYMAPRRYAMVVPATLDNICNSLAIDLEGWRQRPSRNSLL
jgi:hypothetical protein